jgi:carboxyl-terminal processing protease
MNRSHPGVNWTWCFMASTHVIIAALFSSLISGSVAAESEFPVGLWRARGHAQALEINQDTYKLYDVTDISSNQTDEGAMADFYKIYRKVASRPSQDELVLWDEGVLYHFDRIEGLPGRHFPDDDAIYDPEFEFEVLWHYFAENYCGFEARGLDWNATYELYRPKITHDTSEHELWRVFAEMLQPLDDAHVFASNRKSGQDRQGVRSGKPTGLRRALMNRHPGSSRSEMSKLVRATREARDLSLKQDLLRGNYRMFLEGKFVSGWLQSDIGYLSIQRMTGLVAEKVDVIDPVVAAVDSTMAFLINEFASARAMIVDVRGNPGGNDVIPIALARWFADDSTTFSVSYRHSDVWSAPQTTSVTPSEEPGFTGPVFLLIDQNTVSAAETFAMILDDFQHVTLIGETTRGALAGSMFKSLPQGGIVGVPVGLVRNARGDVVEGRGIAPDVVAECYPEDHLESGYRIAIDKALSLIDRPTENER